jgi:hypothetical protein
MIEWSQMIVGSIPYAVVAFAAAATLVGSPAMIQRA